jgi:serine protease Do
MLSTIMIRRPFVLTVLGLAGLCGGQTTQQVDPPTEAPTTAATLVDAGSVDTRSVVGGGSLFPDATPESVLKVTRQVFPAVVRLDVAQQTYEGGKRVLRRGLGSGIIIDDQGHILTNYHVAGRAAEIFITLSNKERVKGRLIGDDHWTDIAVVQMDMDEVRSRKFDFSFAQLGNSDTLVPGQDVIAIGTPFGLSRTLTLGVVSNTERTFYPEKQSIDDFETGEFSNWIQMDTPIAPGNSGGPLVDLEGRLVGINTRGIQGQSLNFAIPINTARKAAEEILSSADRDAGKPGRVTRAYIGVDFRPLQDLENFYNIDVNQGALISSVDKGSPASVAGLKPQDILLAINDQPINVRFPEEIAPVKQMIAGLQIGHPVRLTLLRNGTETRIDVSPERLESRVGEEREFKNWGLTVRDVTRTLAVDRRLDDDKGVIVTSVTSGMAASKADIEEGDVIRGVDGADVVDLEAFVVANQKAADDKRETVLVDIKRGRAVQSKVIKLK